MIHAQRAKGSLLFLADMTSAATTTANLDTLGAHYATIGILAKNDGTAITGITLALTESDDTVVSNFATFDASNAITGWLPGSSDGELHVYHVNMQGRKRYLRLSLTTGAAATTHDNALAAAWGSLTRNDDGPVGTTDMGDVVVIS